MQENIESKSQQLNLSNDYKKKEKNQKQKEK